jgi:hypothetical protein
MFAGEEDPATIVKELQDTIYALLKQKGYF